MMIVEVRLRVDINYVSVNVQFPEYWAFDTRSNRWLVWPQKKAAVSRAQVDPILPPVTAISCDDEILIIL